MSAQVHDSVHHFSAKSRVDRLVRLAKERNAALILTHDNPDPDSMASAWALAVLLERKASVPARIAYGGIVGRAENMAFMRVLKIPAVPVSQIVFEEFDLFCLVDTQQAIGNHSLPDHCRAEVIIDHHPTRDDAHLPPFADVGGTYGATSTLLTGYLRAARLEPPRELATALYYGINTDTRDLERETQAEDVECHQWLFPRIDRSLLAQIEHPALPARYFQLHHAAIEKARVFRGAVITDMGEVYSPDMVAEVAERLSFLEHVTWSLAAGSFRNALYLSLRCTDRRMRAGKLIREACVDLGGSAGGHGSMAGARLPLTGTRSQRAALKREVFRRFRDAFGVVGERGTALLSAEEK